MQFKRTNALAVALGVTLAGAATASAGGARGQALSPVPGGMSERLAGLAESVSQDPGTFRAKLSETLEKSRTEAHELIDSIVDSGELDSWLHALDEQSGGGLARELIGKSSHQVRNVLHGHLDRKLAKLGTEITHRLDGVPKEQLKRSYLLALKDMAIEEVRVVRSAHASLDQDEAGNQAPRAPDPAAVVDAPRAPWFGSYDGRARGASWQLGMSPSQYRTMQIAQQRSWYQHQLAATTWNNKVSRFNRYLYGARQPWYSNPRVRAYQRTRFPAGYYYRPDRVDRVVRRGLWGAAAVAATPFALVASIF